LANAHRRTDGNEFARFWRAHLGVLGELGYAGLLSLETHWRLEKIDESLLHLPAGHAFSHGGETASRTCLHNLKSLLETQ
jgi:hypothetical protein